MIAYVDASVLLRIVLLSPLELVEWAEIDLSVSSELLIVECSRAVDRLRLTGSLDAEEIGQRLAIVKTIISRTDIVPLSSSILGAAAEPLPAILGTLDAIHLATAMAYRRTEPALQFATHDKMLARAARATGFTVVGA